MKNIKGSLILLVAALIWGTAFVAQTSAANSVQTFLLLVIAIRDGSAKRKQQNTEQNEAWIPSKWPIKGGVFCGLALFCAMGFQQGGISVYPDDVAVAGRSGFLTATYVVMVAIYVQFKGKKLHPFVACSIVGTIFDIYTLEICSLPGAQFVTQDTF